MELFIYCSIKLKAVHKSIYIKTDQTRLTCITTVAEEKNMEVRD